MQQRAHSFFATTVLLSESLHKSPIFGRLNSLCESDAIDGLVPQASLRRVPPRAYSAIAVTAANPARCAPCRSQAQEHPHKNTLRCRNSRAT